MEISPEVQAVALEMLEELRSRRLTVILVPNPEKPDSIHKLRAVEISNPAWYQELCAQYPARTHKKKPSTIIRRSCVLKALQELAEGRNSSLYTERLLPFVKENATMSAEEWLRKFWSY